MFHKILRFLSSSYQTIHCHFWSWHPLAYWFIFTNHNWFYVKFRIVLVHHYLSLIIPIVLFKRKLSQLLTYMDVISTHLPIIQQYGTHSNRYSLNFAVIDNCAASATFPQVILNLSEMIFEPHWPYFSLIPRPPVLQSHQVPNHQSLLKFTFLFLDTGIDYFFYSILLH